MKGYEKVSPKALTSHVFHSSVNQTDILGLKHNTAILHYNRGPLSQVLVDILSDARYKQKISARNIFCVVLQSTATLASMTSASRQGRENNEDNQEISPDSRS